MTKPTLSIRYDGTSRYTVEGNYAIICGLSRFLKCKAQSNNANLHVYKLTFHRDKYMEAVDYISQQGYHCLVM